MNLPSICFYVVLRTHISLFHSFFVSLLSHTQAFRAGFYSDSIVFIVQGWYAAKWWTVPHNTCSLRQMTAVIRNVLLIDMTMFGDRQIPVLGLVTISVFNIISGRFVRHIYKKVAVR